MAKNSGKSTPTHFINRYLPWSIGTGIFFFILYASMVSPVNVGYGASDELLSVANNLGIARPPGYPLYLAVLYLATRLPLSGVSLAMKGHLLSSLFSSIAISITFISAWHLYEKIITNYKRKYTLSSKSLERLFFSFISAITLGLTGLFWLYALIAEIFSLSALFTSIFALLFILLLSRHHQRSLSSLWYGICVVLGLAISHHQFLVLLLPGLLYIAWRLRSKLTQNQLLIGIGAGVLSFILPYTLLFVFQSQNPAISWNPELSFEGISKFISKGELTGEIYKQRFYQNAVVGQFDINSGINSLSNYTNRVITYLGIWIVLIALLALYSGIKRNRHTFFSLLLLYVFLGLFLAAYLIWPSEWGSQASTLPQFIPGFVLLPLLLLFGWLEFSKRLGTALSILFKQKLVHAILILIIISPFIYHAYSTHQHVNLKQYTHINQRYSQILKSLDTNAVLTCYSDTACAALLYSQSVEGNRNDVEIVPLAYPLVQSTLDQPDISNFNYPDNPFILYDIVTWNLDKKPVYAVDLNSFYNTFFGFDIPVLYYVPKGYFGQITKALPENIDEPDYSLTQKWLDTKTSEYDPMRHFHKTQVAKDHIFNGSFAIKSDNRQAALHEFNLASNIFQQYSFLDKQQFNSLRENQESGSSRDNFSLGSSSPTAQELLDYVPVLIEEKRYQRAYQAALAAVSIEPANPAARLTLAKLYDELGDLNFARIEFANLLRIDPNNQEAQDRLSQLNTL